MITTAADLHSIQQSTINRTSNNLLPTQQSGVITIAEVLVLVDEEQQKTEMQQSSKDREGVHILHNASNNQPSFTVHNDNATVNEVNFKIIK